jgi:hypothetical protein
LQENGLKISFNFEWEACVIGQSGPTVRFAPPKFTPHVTPVPEKRGMSQSAGRRLNGLAWRKVFGSLDAGKYHGEPHKPKKKKKLT